MYYGSDRAPQFMIKKYCTCFESDILREDQILGLDFDYTPHILRSISCTRVFDPGVLLTQQMPGVLAIWLLRRSTTSIPRVSSPFLRVWVNFNW